MPDHILKIQVAATVQLRFESQSATSKHSIMRSGQQSTGRNFNRIQFSRAVLILYMIAIVLTVLQRGLIFSTSFYFFTLHMGSYESLLQQRVTLQTVEIITSLADNTSYVQTYSTIVKWIVSRRPRLTALFVHAEIFLTVCVLPTAGNEGGVLSVVLYQRVSHCSISRSPLLLVEQGICFTQRPLDINEK